MDDQIKKINEDTELRAAVFKVTPDESNGDRHGEAKTSSSLRNADFDIIFTHPESCVSSKEGLRFLQSDIYQLQESVQAIVVDEAHCILQW